MCGWYRHIQDNREPIIRWREEETRADRIMETKAKGVVKSVDYC
jgi:hypothetical protein